MPQSRSAPRPAFGHLSDWHDLVCAHSALALKALARKHPAKKALKAEIKKGDAERRRIRKFTKKHAHHPAVALARELPAVDLALLYVILRNTLGRAQGYDVFRPTALDLLVVALDLEAAKAIEQIGRFAQDAPLRRHGLVVSGSALQEPLLTSVFYPSDKALRLAFGADDATRVVVADAIPQPEDGLVNEAEGAVLVWPPELSAQIERIVHAVKTRRRVLEQTGLADRLPTARGIHVLLQGPPGTGKTLAARTIATRLEQPPRIVHAPDIQSRWIGVAEKTVRQMYRAAARQHAVLVFDEVDGLIVRRGETAQPWIRSLVDTFLVEMEAFEGVAVYTTNHPQHLDPALERRLSFRLEVPRPGPAERAKIWTAHLPPGVPLAGDVDYDALAAHDLTGAEIQNAVLSALTEASLRDPLLVTAADLQAGIENATRGRWAAGPSDRVGFSNA